MARGAKGGPSPQPAAGPDAGAARPPRSVDIASLAGDALRSYARRIGVSRRDCEGLTEDRLRQNCKAFLANHFELIAEG